MSDRDTLAKIFRETGYALEDERMSPRDVISLLGRDALNNLITWHAKQLHDLIAELEIGELAPGTGGSIPDGENEIGEYPATPD